MSFASFERLPYRLGWKHEYYGGKAHITPSYLTVQFLLELTPRQGIDRRGIRPVTPQDAEALVEPFLAAFALAPEYADYPAARFRQTAAEYLAGFFGDVRGRWSPASVVAQVGRRMVGAALAKSRPQDPLLDCIFVRPEYARHGWATALTDRVVQGLRAQGETQLRSYVLLANAPSLAWHQGYGFRELPDLWVASHRARVYSYELERHRQRRDLADTDLAALEALVARCWDEVRRLEELKKKKGFEAAFPPWV
jgi:GNAT superfamily N-acetyltransferase